MTDYITIGCTPCDEPCVPVGSYEYNRLSRIELQVFAAQCKRVLEKQFNTIKTNLRMKSFPHDFGSYRELIAEYHDKDSTVQAFWLESNTPKNWDDEAKKQLTELGYDL